MARLALHGNAEVVKGFRTWQENADTGTDNGRAALVAAVRKARKELKHDDVGDEDLAVLLFGYMDPPSSALADSRG